MSFTFNRIKKDFIKIAYSEARPGIAPVENVLMPVARYPGAYVSETNIGVRRLSIPIIIYHEGYEDLQKKKEEIAEWLYHEEPKELVFDDEPDRIYYAKFDGELNFEEHRTVAFSTLEFICPDPFKYGLEKEAVFPSDVVTLTNEGTADADPIFELEVKEPVTFAMIQNDKNEYMMIGKPYDAAQEQPFMEEERIMWDEMSSTTGWTVPQSVEDGVIAGKMVSNGYMFIPESFGTGSRWHGPALKTSIPQAPLQDFRMDVLVEFWNTNVQGSSVGKIEIELLNDSDEVVAKVGLVDSQVGMNSTVGQARAGSTTRVSHYLINESGDYWWVWNNFYGILRIGRRGKHWFAYISKIDRNTGKYHSGRYRTWDDIEGVITDSIYQVRVYMAQYDNRPQVSMGLHDIKIWRFNRFENAVPYIAQEGDIITFDHKEKAIFINGEPRKDLKDFGASYFSLKPGKNQLIVYPEESFEVKCKYRERFK